MNIAFTLTKIIQNIKHLSSQKKTKRFTYQQIFQSNRNQFSQLGITNLTSQRKRFQQSLQRMNIFKPLSKRQPIAQLLSKYDFQNYEGLKRYFKQHPDDLIPDDQDLNNCYVNCRNDLLQAIKYHHLRVTIVNGLRYFSSMVVDNEFGLVEKEGRSNRNLEEFHREGYLRLCQELFVAQGQEKKAEREEEQRGAEQSKHNQWVEGWHEIKRSYLEESKKKG